MSTSEIIALVGGSIIIPWLVFVTKAILAVSNKQEDMHSDIKWLRREHEPEMGLQSWKNPGLVEAVDRLSELITSLKEWLMSHAETGK